MLFKAVTTKQFEKDIKLAKKRGKDIEKIKNVIEMLVQGTKLAVSQFFVFLKKFQDGICSVRSYAANA